MHLYLLCITADLYGFLLFRDKEVHSRPHYQDFFRCFSTGAREGVLGQAEHDTCSGNNNNTAKMLIS